MNRYLVACIFFFLGMTLVRPVHAQDSFAGIDLLYSEFAHPREDALRAIKQRDYRFVATDRRNASGFSPLVSRISASACAPGLTPPITTRRSWNTCSSAARKMPAANVRLLPHSLDRLLALRDDPAHGEAWEERDCRAKRS
ncbi:MAG: hypothetical protein H0V54_03820 [Chthoniobacterales bacterium]|nr:hypothetical protein [Chthoniobacterales bacterium]